MSMIRTVFGAVALVISGCAVHTYSEPATVTSGEVYDYPSTTYEGRTVYLRDDDRWAYRDGTRWVYIEREPQPLVDYRVRLQSDPGWRARHIRKENRREERRELKREDRRERQEERIERVHP